MGWFPFGTAGGRFLQLSAPVRERYDGASDGAVDDNVRVEKLLPNAPERLGTTGLRTED